MLKGLLGKKIGMTQIFDEDGAAVPVTIIEAGPCYVTQVRNVERDGYVAVQLGFSETKPKHLSGGQKGHLNAAGVETPLRYIREFRTNEAELNVGDVVKADVFAVGDNVDVIGTAKGKGFAGGMKRYGFGGGPRTHGQSDRQRSVGSIGATSTPGRVFKGKRMPGHMGTHRVTVQNQMVAFVDVERNLIGIKGAVPGSKGGLVMIKEARKQ